MARRSDHTRKELRALAVDAAARIIAEEGIAAVKIRKVAELMGYTSGTLYQMFENLDALKFAANLTTLERLGDEVEASDVFENDAEGALRGLAGIYLSFARENPNALFAVFEHHSGRREQAPEAYEDQVSLLVGYGARAISGLVQDPAKIMVEARVLWSALYGIVSLALAENQSQEVETSDLLDALVTTYVAGLRVRYGAG